MEATITSKGQVTLPKALRDALGLKAGDRILFAPDQPGEYRIKRKKTYTLAEAKGLLPPVGRKISLEEMDEAVARAAAERFLRSTKSTES